MEITTASAVTLTDLMNISKDLAQLNLGYLGISVTIIAVLGGAFYLFNIKPLKDSLDKQEESLKTLKTEALALFDSSNKNLQNELSIFKEQQMKDLLGLLKQEKDKISLESKNKVAALEASILERIESISEKKDDKLKEIILSETDNRVRTLEKSLTTEANDSKNSLEKKVGEIKSSGESFKGRFKDLERRIKELELYKFSKENQMGAVYRAIELLKDDIDENNQYSIPGRLEQLKEQIAGITLKADIVSLIEEQLTRLENQRMYNTLVDNIRESYSKKV